MTQGCVMTLTQDHISKVKVTVHTYQKSVPGNNSSLQCWIWIFHTIVVDDPRVCHDLDPRSYLQGQGHSAHISKNVCPGHSSSLQCWIWIFHTIVVDDPRVCHDLDPRSYLQGQGHSAHISKNVCPGHSSSLPC